MRELTTAEAVGALGAIGLVSAVVIGTRFILIAIKRATVVRLRDERQIDDTVLRQIQSKLDFEEVRLSRREITE